VGETARLIVSSEVMAANLPDIPEDYTAIKDD
jgi:hypothetical protein